MRRGRGAWHPDPGIEFRMHFFQVSGSKFVRAKIGCYMVELSCHSADEKMSLVGSNQLDMVFFLFLSLPVSQPECELVKRVIFIQA